MQVLATVRVIVKEWARRNGAADGPTIQFIRAVSFPPHDSPTVGVAAHRHLGSISSVRHARLQLQNEWALDMRIADMAQKVRKALQ
jgi:hypothetical protein